MTSSSTASSRPPSFVSGACASDRDRARRNLRAFDQVLAHVTEVEYPRIAIPQVSFNRLNRHYEPAVLLARLILRSTSIELRRGGLRASSFLVDMNKVFEDFMVRALRETLGVTEPEFPQGASGRRMFLDCDGKVRLEPDLSWWRGGRCVFVGDLKYKKARDQRVPNADIYQLLAYTIAADLAGGLLVYAQGEKPPTVHTVRHAGKRLEVMAIDLSGAPEQILAEADRIAGRIRSMRFQTDCGSYGGSSGPGRCHLGGPAR